MIYFCFAGGVDATRAMFGPLSSTVCTIQIFLKCICFGNFGILIFAITFTKFWFVCIWKAVRDIDDNFFATFIYFAMNAMVILAVAAKFYGPGAPVLNHVSFFKLLK